MLCLSLSCLCVLDTQGSGSGCRAGTWSLSRQRPGRCPGPQAPLRHPPRAVLPERDGLIIQGAPGPGWKAHCPSDEGAMLDIPGSLPLGAFVDFLSGFRGVGSGIAHTYPSHGDLSAGTMSSSGGKVCPSAGSQAGRGFASHAEKGRAPQRLSVEKQPCPALGRLGCVSQGAVHVGGPSTGGLLAPLGSKELLLGVRLSPSLSGAGEPRAEGSVDLLHER